MLSVISDDRFQACRIFLEDILILRGKQHFVKAYLTEGDTVNRFKFRKTQSRAGVSEALADIGNRAYTRADTASDLIIIMY